MTGKATVGGKPGSLPESYGSCTAPSRLPRPRCLTRPMSRWRVLLDGDWHQRRPNDDAEIIDQAMQVHELTGTATLLASCDYRQPYRTAAVSLPACRSEAPKQPGRDRSGNGQDYG